MRILSSMQAGAATVEHAFDRLRFRFRARLGRVRPPVLVPFRGFGTEEELILHGRALEERAYLRASDGASRWTQLRHMFQRFQSDEFPGLALQAIYNGTTVSTTTDGEGYFVLRIPTGGYVAPDRVWHEVELRLENGFDETEPAVGHVMVPPIETEFGVISDIDDTIIKTSATSLWKMIRITLLNTPESRLPFQGVAAFYLALQRGRTGTGHNPLFYVSSSPWNLYDVLESFMDVHGIPFGPIFLRDFGFSHSKLFAVGHRAHKRAQIERLLRVYHTLPFLLIGDSGQRDPEIYAEVVRDFPGRVRAVYIRDVGLTAGRSRTRDLARVVRQQGVEMLLVEDTEAAAVHAAERGFIDPSALANVRADKAKDESAPNDLAQLFRTNDEKHPG